MNGMEKLMSNFEKINNNLLKHIMNEYPEMLSDVLNQKYCDIDYSFLGFVDTYYYLSKIIPLHWTVIDFGCAYNAQAYFFRKHEAYIGVDNDCENCEKRFCFENTKLFKGSIAGYLKQNPPTKEMFAICNYVPSDETKMVREYYLNCYIFYPSGKPISINMGGI